MTITHTRFESDYLFQNGYPIRFKNGYQIVHMLNHARTGWEKMLLSPAKTGQRCLYGKRGRFTSRWRDTCLTQASVCLCTLTTNAVVGSVGARHIIPSYRMETFSVYAPTAGSPRRPLAGTPNHLFRVASTQPPPSTLTSYHPIDLSGSPTTTAV